MSADISMQALVSGYLAGAKAARELADGIEADSIPVSAPEALRMLARGLEKTVEQHEPLPSLKSMQEAVQ
jgi:hypothetical protein